MTTDTRIKKIRKAIYVALKNLYEIQDNLGLDQFAIIVLESLMLLEREVYLKSFSGKKDAGNGSYLRTFRCLRTNSLQINIPRTRNGLFKPMTLEIIKRQKEEVYAFALLLYRRGLSSRDVSAIMEEFFGESISRETINNLAENFHEIRKEWEKIRLDAFYKVIYCDALYAIVKRGDSYSKEAVHIIYGVKEDTTRELLLLEVNPTEGSTNWGNYLEKLKARGVKDISLIVVDGLLNFENEAKRVFPNAALQKCVVHLQRNFMNKVRPKDKASFTVDFREVFDNFESTSTKEKALQKANIFAKKWERFYPKLVAKLLDKDYMPYYLTYIDFPAPMRRLIYTTNSIENLNRQIRKVIKTKVAFGKTDNLLDLVFMIIKDFENNNWRNTQ